MVAVFKGCIFLFIMKKNNQFKKIFLKWYLTNLQFEILNISFSFIN